MKLYFAYGSNLWEDQMLKRCPDCRKLGRADLAGYRWIISPRGYANIVASERDAVEGVLYEISPADEVSLDKYEGVASGCYDKAELPLSHNGKDLIALIYIDPSLGEGPPKPEYITRINAGLADAGLSPEYVSRYVRKFIPANPS